MSIVCVLERDGFKLEKWVIMIMEKGSDICVNIMNLKFRILVVFLSWF